MARGVRRACVSARARTAQAPHAALLLRFASHTHHIRVRCHPSALCACALLLHPRRTRRLSHAACVRRGPNTPSLRSARRAAASSRHCASASHTRSCGAAISSRSASGEDPSPYQRPARHAGSAAHAARWRERSARRAARRHPRVADTDTPDTSSGGQCKRKTLHDGRRQRRPSVVQWDARRAMGASAAPSAQRRKERERALRVVRVNEPDDEGGHQIRAHAPAKIRTRGGARLLLPL
jgi:hypothetical protein